MASVSASRDAILFQNSTRDVILLDIPRSVSLAQGTPTHPYTAQILSSPALEEPYPSTEPKTRAAKDRLIRTKPQNVASELFPETLLRQALEEITATKNDVWCLKRNVFISAAERQVKKRKLRAISEQDTKTNSTDSAQTVKSDSFTFEESKLSLGCFLDLIDLAALVSNPDGTTHLDTGQIANRLIHNSHPSPLPLSRPKSNSQPQKTYTIPPHAKFFLSKITQETALAMSMSALTIYPSPSPSAGPGQFDFIILDPPWQNRSVKRAAKYETMRENLDPMEVLQSMLGQHIAPNGLVACWITHKLNVRTAVLEAFETWDVRLVEEWAWLKVTTKGVPVSELNGLWRKPYEILLVGRKQGNRNHEDFKQQETKETEDSEIRRRVIIGVPDLHSRKPNLKALFDDMLPPGYRALEIFARNLTAEWWVWGDEVLKYAIVQ